MLSLLMFNLLGTTPSRPGIKALKTSLVSKFQEAASQERLQKDDVRTLEGLKSLISGFGLDVYCEIELIADSRPLISISASKCKTYSEYSGPFHPVILSLYADGSYEIRVNIFDRVAWGKIEIDQLELLHDLVLKVSKHSSFRICPGLREAKYQDLILKLGYQPAKLFSKTWPWPVNRHVECLRWHVPNNSRSKDSSLVDGCGNCKVLSRHLDTILERRKKNKNSSIRRSAGSKHRIDVLSPTSKKIRLKNIRGERKYYRKIAKKYWEKTKIWLNDKENHELSLLVNEIESSVHGQQALEQVFAEAETTKAGRGKTLKEVWQMDRIEFLKDQRKNGKSIFQIKFYNDSIISKLFRCT